MFFSLWYESETLAAERYFDIYIDVKWNVLIWLDLYSAPEDQFPRKCTVHVGTDILKNRDLNSYAQNIQVWRHHFNSWQERIENLDL